ncbi:MAG: response regulator [Sphingomonadales bacterium]
MARILLVDDDGDLRRVLKRAMQKGGHEVQLADSGIAALPLLEQERFDLLLTDIVMPDMDGIELTRCASKLDPELRIMFITGFAAVALNPDNELPSGAKVLSKPFHLRDLVAEIEKVLTA